MKYSLTIILFILLNGCGYGQYPSTKYVPKDIQSYHSPVIGKPIPIDTFKKYYQPYYRGTFFYPDTRYKGNDVGKVFRVIKDSGSYWLTKPGNDTIFVFSKTYIEDSVHLDTIIISGSPSKLEPQIQAKWYYDTIPVTEASFYYWKQYLFYSHQKDIELDIIRKQRNPSYKEYDRLMDSVVRYKKLIDKTKKND